MRSFMEGILFGTVVGGLLGLTEHPPQRKRKSRESESLP